MCERIPSSEGGIGFRAWEAVELATSAVPAVQVQQVMMPLGGLVDRPNALAWAREAAARGAVALGGAPWLADNPSRATREAAEVAAELGIGLDLHVDETDDPSVSTLTDLAEAANDADLSGRAVAAHCCSMASDPSPWPVEKPKHSQRQAWLWSCVRSAASPSREGARACVVWRPCACCGRRPLR
jgi:hypothetical protein